MTTQDSPNPHESPTPQDPPTAQPSGSSADDQTAALQAENARLRAQLDAKNQGPDFRSIVSWILVVLAIVAVVAGSVALWLDSTITDEDQFVATFADLPQEEAVATRISEEVGAELIEVADVEGFVSQTLPEELTFLAAPLTSGVQDVTVRATTEVVASDAFASIWQVTLRGTHKAVMLVLSGDGSVTLDLNEVADAVTAQLSELGITAFDDVETDLPEVVLFESDELAAASAVLNMIETLGWLLPLLALLLIAAAIWASPNRRRTTSALGFGTAAVLLVVLAALRITRGAVTGGIEDETERAAIEVTWDTTLRFFIQGAWALIVLGLVIGFVAWAFGPSPRAERVRAWWSSVLARWREPLSARPQSAAEEFVSNWKRPIEWGIAVLAVLFIIGGPPPSTLSVTITVLVALAAIAFVEVVGGRGEPPAEQSRQPVPAAAVKSGDAGGVAASPPADAAKGTDAGGVAASPPADAAKGTDAGGVAASPPADAAKGTDAGGVAASPPADAAKGTDAGGVAASPPADAAKGTDAGGAAPAPPPADGAGSSDAN